MGGPWEKYAAATPDGAPSAPSGPWQKYAGTAAPVDNSPAVPMTDPTADEGTSERMVRGIVGAVAPVVAPVGRFVDRFTGAPVRAAIGAFQNHENPIEAGMSQFGGDPENAPTGKEIVQKAGLGDTALSDKIPSIYSKDGKGWALRKGGLLDPTASGAAGLGVDMVADPLNLVGVGEVGDLAKAGLKSVAGIAGKGVELGAKAADVISGTEAATKGVEAAKAAATTTGKVAGSAKYSINKLLNPTVAADASDMAAIAQKNGIPPELISPAHEFGDASTITRLQKSIAEGALGQPYLEAHNAGIAKTSEALDNNITSNFGKAPATAADAGQTLKDSVDQHVSNVFDNADLTYKTAASKFPGIEIDPDAMNALDSKAIGLKREAQRIARTSADPTQLSQAANLEKWADVIGNAKGSYKEMSEIVQNVGKAAFGKTPVGQIPADVKKLRELYNTGSEALIQSVRNTSAAAADELVKNNMDIKEMLGDKSMLGNALQDQNPERVYNSLIKNGNSNQIDTLRKILPPDTFNAMRSKYLQDLVQYHPDEMGVNFGATMRKMQNNSDKLTYLFSPEELKDTTDILKFGDRYGSPVLSKSGTGGSGGFKGFVKNLEGAAVDAGSLDYLKNKARGSSSAVSPAAAGTTSATSSAADAGRPILRDRGPMENRLKGAQTVSPSMYQRPSLPSKTQIGDAPQPQQHDVPETGPNKWANDGIDRLKEHSDDPDEIESMRDKLMSDPKGAQLLIAASDLKPGSKGMANLLERIRQLHGSSSS